jgi:hypothetical protein
MNDSKSDIFVFSADELGLLADQEKNNYRTADPWPHAVFDNFLPEPIAKTTLKNFPKPDYPMWLDWRNRDTHNQPKKQGIGHAANLEKASPYIHNVIFAFNSFPFLYFLERLTGIKHLLPDPYLNGGGIHQILSGGKLSIHTDFNHNNELGLYRRVNVLFYLNEDWQPHYNGALELWASDMGECRKSVPPIFNRMVVFETNKRSFHGHPKPLNVPENITRKSIALYYYTSQADPTELYDEITDWQQTDPKKI